MKWARFSKSTRNISLPKVQDARVDQSVIQRMFGVGNLSIETAGETSRLTIRNVDQPQQVADEILAASHNRLRRRHAMSADRAANWRAKWR